MEIFISKTMSVAFKKNKKTIICLFDFTYKDYKIAMYHIG